tara:strand:- start:33 stop:980 length:948 start_codon:yes stop_codon:yes gene_type:complete
MEKKTLTENYIKYKSTHIKYYKKNSEKIKQKAKDIRLEFNKTLPNLNLVCEYCNKPFILPGMKENGHKQKPFKYCSSICHKREERLRKLWIPKWLYNFYLEKKLFRIVTGFKNSKYSMFSWNRRWRILGNHNYTFKIFFAGVYDKRFGWFWNPKCFWRRKFTWLDNYIIKKSKERREAWKRMYGKTDKHRKSVRDWQRRQPKDTNYNISKALRASIIGALKRQQIRKRRKTEELLGTDRKTAIKHIESLFKPEMTWKNHGIGPDKWNIDHIIPCASFDLKCPVQQLACCYYKNLQPLWTKENMKKSDKILAHEHR